MDEATNYRGRRTMKNQEMKKQTFKKEKANINNCTSKFYQ